MIDLYPNETFFIMWPMFLVVLVLFNKYLFQPTIELIDARESSTDVLKEQAEELTQKNEVDAQKYEAAMAKARADASKVREQILQEAREEERSILDAARKENEASLAKLSDEISAQKDIVEKELKQYAEEISKLIVDKVMEREAA